LNLKSVDTDFIKSSVSIAILYSQVHETNCVRFYTDTNLIPISYGFQNRNFGIWFGKYDTEFKIPYSVITICSATAVYDA